MFFCAFAVFESAFTVLVVVGEHSVIDDLAVTFTFVDTFSVASH